MKILYAISLVLLTHLSLAQTNISDIRKIRSGKVVTVYGHVTASFGQLSFIQDHAAGIAIYGANVNEDDSVTVTGKLSKFNGLLEVIADSTTIITTHLKPITPKTVTRLDDFEAMLVRMPNVFLNPHALFFYPGRSGPIIKNGDTSQYWIDENTDIPGYSIPKSTNITGVVSRYGTQLQLLPRNHNDIDNATIAQQTINTNLKILNWNVEFFGAPKYGPTDNNLQLANVTSVLNTTHADIVALQEVSNDDMFKQLVKQLPGYGGRCSPRYSYSFDQSGDYPPQKLCFVYNTSSVKIIREKILFAKYFDEHPSEIFSSGRLPYLLEIESGGHRMNIVNIHAKSGYESGDRTRRITDAKLLKDTLDRYYTNIVLLGDLNDRLEGSYENFLSDARYKCISKTLSDEGWHSTISYDDVIDHQIISAALTGSFADIHLVNPFLSISLYSKTTSDHLPVISEFEVSDAVVGIKADQETLVFPNPVHDDLWFSPPGSNITIMNAYGSVIMKKQSAHPPISLRECAPGLYYVMINERVFPILKD